MLMGKRYEKEKSEDAEERGDGCGMSFLRREGMRSEALVETLMLDPNVVRHFSL